MRSVLIALALTACAHPAAEYRGNVTVKSAELVPLDADVRVLADTDKPMFHAAGSFWLFHDAAWYRGNTVRGPFVRVKRPPWQIRKIDQPYAYVHYRQDHPREQTATSGKVEEPSKDLKNARTNRMFTF